MNIVTIKNDINHTSQGMTKMVPWTRPGYEHYNGEPDKFTKGHIQRTQPELLVSKTRIWNGSRGSLQILTDVHCINDLEKTELGQQQIWRFATGPTMTKIIIYLGLGLTRMKANLNSLMTRIERVLRTTNDQDLGTMRMSPRCKGGCRNALETNTSIHPTRT